MEDFPGGINKCFLIKGTKKEILSSVYKLNISHSIISIYFIIYQIPAINLQNLDFHLHQSQFVFLV